MIVQVNSINIAKKEVYFLSKNILEYIQTIYEGLKNSFVTFSRFKIVCQ